MGIFYHMQINKAYLFFLKAYQTSAFEQSPFYPPWFYLLLVKRSYSINFRPFLCQSDPPILLCSNLNEDGWEAFSLLASTQGSFTEVHFQRQCESPWSQVPACVALHFPAGWKPLPQPGPQEENVPRTSSKNLWGLLTMPVSTVLPKWPSQLKTHNHFTCQHHLTPLDPFGLPAFLVLFVIGISISHNRSLFC